MNKSTTALTLAALVAAGGIYLSSATLTSAFATSASQANISTASADAPANPPTFVALPRSTSHHPPQPAPVSVAVEDRRDIRCYYRADLTSEYQVPGSTESPRPPFVRTGIEEVGFDAKTNPTSADPNSGLLQVTDPINQCSRVWDGGMILEGINDELVPDGFVSPPPGELSERTSVPGSGKDQNGKPLYDDPNIRTFGNFIPFLTACVVDGRVAVIPGPADICSGLGVPSLAA
ncbi:hypothetical protein FQP90_08160 [Paenarthrobacter nitroguajacolicus]|uniref:Uncharacterized protein n=1 Tax=Paenarthrobacter nitroguajacolicus TaxID=211146 RepID=A0A558H4A1_PAENT|nr:hypothetical protein [Paenarthrobacter nitroguajacolicus]TVU63957.1 hypothetical protein FQP90_08160 [Paenarthrobacter nitroguajacolicus]